MSSARARGSATPSPELTPIREELLRIQAFALDLARGSEVSPRHESDAAPSLAMSKGTDAEHVARNHHTEMSLLTHSVCLSVTRFTLSRSIPHYSCTCTELPYVAPVAVHPMVPVSMGVPETLDRPGRHGLVLSGRGTGTFILTIH